MGTRAPINISPLGSAKTYLLSALLCPNAIGSVVGDEGGGDEPTPSMNVRAHTNIVSVVVDGRKK
jgi:hypothetical protein